MAVAPTMIRAASAVAPSMAARLPQGAVAPVDATAPTTGLQPRNGVMAGLPGFGYDMLATMGQQGAQGWFVPPEPPRPGHLDSALFTTSSEIFGVLFAPHPQYSIAPGLPGAPSTKAAVQHSVETYEFTSAVIHNELAAIGEQLSVTV